MKSRSRELNAPVSRRDFLKLAGLAQLSLAIPSGIRGRALLQGSGQRQNVLVVVLDAFSSYNMSLYGYPRSTTPNIDRLSKRAIVYHDHYSGGNFTSPGTATLLTGVYPFTHRSIQFRGRTVPRFYQRNAFSVFDDYHRFAYTHNSWAHIVLRPMASHIDELPAVEDLYLERSPRLIQEQLSRDDDVATVAWGRTTGLGFNGYARSLYISRILQTLRDRSGLGDIRRMFPRGMPGDGEVVSFVLETAIDWLVEQVASSPRPFFAYVHLLPPHAPYRTRADFVDRFRGDSYTAPRKPADAFAEEMPRDEALERRYYDEYILYADAEFGRLYDSLESSGALEDTWLVLTSDHGELFERGLKAHGSDTLYQPEIRVPLLIFEPGRQAGLHINGPTSAVDLLPTLAHVTGHSPPPWGEGMILPPFSPSEASPERAVYVVMAEDNNPRRPVDRATLAIVKGNYKLQYYFGYRRLPNHERILLYDIAADPEELVDLAPTRPGVAAALLAELQDRLADAEKPYRA